MHIVLKGDNWFVDALLKRDFFINVSKVLLCSLGIHWRIFRILFIVITTNVSNFGTIVHVSDSLSSSMSLSHCIFLTHLAPVLRNRLVMCMLKRLHHIVCRHVAASAHVSFNFGAFWRRDARCILSHTVELFLHGCLQYFCIVCVDVFFFRRRVCLAIFLSPGFVRFSLVVVVELNCLTWYFVFRSCR